MIDVSQSTIDRVYNILGNFSYHNTAATNALQAAMNRGMITARSEIAKGVSKVYNIRQYEVKRNVEMKTHKANQDQLEAYFIFNGHQIPIVKFMSADALKVRIGEIPDKSKYGRRRRENLMSILSAKVRKDEPMRMMPREFLATIKGELGVYKRATRKRNPIDQIYAPSVPQMMEDADIIENAREKAQSMFNNRIEHEIQRILDNNGTSMKKVKSRKTYSDTHLAEMAAELFGGI